MIDGFFRYKWHRLKLPALPINNDGTYRAPQVGEYQDDEDWTVFEIPCSFYGRIPQRIEIQNLKSNIYTGPGPMMLMRIPGLLDEQIDWIDSLQSTIIHIELNNNKQPLQEKYDVMIRRISGNDNPGIVNIQGQQYNVPPFAGRPHVSFAIVYYF